tara:strand:- start:338 stop:628 length:291 start_codon:yes stop_codon:yes gene_type:complete
MKFNSNDKVVCINEDIQLNAFAQREFEGLPEKGKVYCVEKSTMIKFTDLPQPVECIYLVGLNTMSIDSGTIIPWEADRFISLSDAKKNAGKWQDSK